MTDGFWSNALPIEGNLFDALLASARFETLGKGRRGAVLVKTDETGRVPIVRTTTVYRAPAQPFRPLHERLARQIEEHASLAVGFNNALIEHYTDAYTTMGAHSDQALDLADASFIAVFSCYQHPAPARPPRRLIVEPKEPGGEPFEVPLNDHGAVLFSVGTNRRFRHKIVVDPSTRDAANEWLGITFRTSKTLVQSGDERVCFVDGTPLTLASDEQRREFFALRRRENREPDFAYPRITYTISESDLAAPVSTERSGGVQRIG